MQTFSIPYYKDHVTLNVPDENLKAAIYPKAESYQAALPEAELVREALEHPIGSEKLCELAKGKKKNHHRNQRPYASGSEQNYASDSACRAAQGKPRGGNYDSHRDGPAPRDNAGRAAADVRRQDRR